jgi:hypothetical protein
MVVNAEIEISREDGERTLEVTANVHNGHIEFFYKIPEKLTQDEWDAAEEKIMEAYNG